MNESMETPFGAKANDPTGDWERLAEQEASRLDLDAEDIGPQVINRPLGSFKVNRNQQRLDFAKGYGDPAYYEKVYAGLEKRFGGRALPMYTKWFEEMNADIERLIEGGINLPDQATEMPYGEGE